MDMHQDVHVHDSDRATGVAAIQRQLEAASSCLASGSPGVGPWECNQKPQPRAMKIELKSEQHTGTVDSEGEWSLLWKLRVASHCGECSKNTSAGQPAVPSAVRSFKLATAAEDSGPQWLGGPPPARPGPGRRWPLALPKSAAGRWRRRPQASSPPSRHGLAKVPARSPRAAFPDCLSPLPVGT